MLSETNCKECGVRFMRARQSAKFCSNACKQLNYRKRNGQMFTNKKKVEGGEVRKTCPHCHKGYWLNRYGRTRKFCSDSCRVSANRFKVDATKRLLLRLQRMDYHMKPFIEAANEGTERFEQYVEGIGWKYDMTLRRYIQKYEKSIQGSF